MTTFANSKQATGDSLTRVGALAGAAGPLLFTAAFVLQNALRSDDDAIAEPVSALGIGEYGWVQGLDFVVFFALMLAFAVGLHRGIRPSRLGWLGPMLFAVAAVGLFVAAAFPLARDADGEIYDPSHHELGGLLFFMGSSLALIAISRRLAADPRWRALSAYSLVAGILALAGGVLFNRLARTLVDDVRLPGNDSASPDNSPPPAPDEDFADLPQPWEPRPVRRNPRPPARDDPRTPATGGVPATQRSRRPHGQV
jgi:hypothetical protein